ncbi:MAG: hypothetical protein HRT88_14675, partial [Lentisphaeraceae bacterium]|nr:hypothetical protein [Lentisphaeraceae bacterium]
MIFKCPDCQSALEAPADVLGKRVQCTHCESKFILEDTPKTAKKKILVTPRPRQSKKRPPKAATNKLLLPGLLLTIIALAVFFFQTRKTSLDHPQLAEKLSTSVSASTAPAATKLIGQKNLFKFAAWSKKYGRTVDINDWMKRNPHPYGQRFDPNRSYFQHRYTTTLGPLGIRTLMHEQSWSRRYLPLLAKFPEFLKDSHGPLWNAFEVVHVQENGPAHTHVQKGDFIVAIEDEVVKSAEWTNLENKFSATKNRGMEIHAGQMIDQAEGRGKIKVKVLRLPKDYKNTPIAARTAELIKEQNFDAGQSAQVALPVEAQYFSIKSADKSHLTLSHMFLVNEQGVKIPLDTLERGKLFKHSAFSQRFINPKTQTWTIQSPFHCDFIIPPGKWKLVGEVHNKSKHSIAISFSQIPRAKFPAALERYCKTLEFKIPRIGSFGKNFDPHCNKVRNYSAILAKRLAIQQAPDGSWPFINSYTTPAFYTSMCGLGLLAEDNPAYQKHIRKAAHYVAYSGQFSAWSWARGINAMFLGEYYLRTKDKSILTGLSLALKRCEDTLLVGYVAGHHFHNPGYSGGGQISGSGTIACALAIAEHTPAKFTRGTALKMMERIQSLAIHGTVPYGRASARSSKRKVFDLNNRWPGQSSTAGVAPYYMAAKISGGSSYFNEIVSRRFRQAPYGDVDGGHGTHTIPYTLGSIAISLCSPEAHKANMQAFLWKLTTQRGFDGFIVNNSNPMEHHTGETVMGKPWWSTGAYLLMMNALKRNLAITGEKQYMAESQKDLPLIL